MKKIVLKFSRLVGYIFIIALLSLLLLEWVYRSYSIDFYKKELKALNPKSLNKKSDNTLLVFGDSFSATANSYVNFLKDSLPSTRVINSSISGTSFLQHKLFFLERVEEFKPQHIIIQIYVGNDLIDYNHPVNWKQLSCARNLYWSVSDYFLSLQFMNYRFGQTIVSNKPQKDPKEDDIFNPNTYNHREKLYFTSNPYILNNSVLAQGKEKHTLFQLVQDLRNTLKKTTIKTSVLIIPHAAQTNKHYLQNMKDIGAKFKHNITGINHFTFYHFVKSELKVLPHVEVVTPISSFIEKKQPLYYHNDPHLNKTGQLELAKYVLNALVIN